MVAKAMYMFAEMLTENVSSGDKMRFSKSLGGHLTYTSINPLTVMGALQRPRKNLS